MTVRRWLVCSWIVSLVLLVLLTLLAVDYLRVRKAHAQAELTIYLLGSAPGMVKEATARAGNALGEWITRPRTLVKENGPDGKPHWKLEDKKQ